jgi:ATP-dependent RNA helicase DDX54/DBP10
VHRVGRTARAGKSGSAWSLVTNDEVPFMLDLQLFTGRPLVFASTFSDSNSRKPQYSNEIVYGSLPVSEISLECESYTTSFKGNVALETLKDSSKNSYKMFLRSRPSATKAAYKRSKEISGMTVGVHPYFGTKYFNYSSYRKH